MNLDSRKNSLLGLSVNIDEILSKYNIQQYYMENDFFDFLTFVQMAMNFDEIEAEMLISSFNKKEIVSTQMNIEDTSFDFSDEELNLIYLDILNLKTA